MSAGVPAEPAPVPPAPALSWWQSALLALGCMLASLLATYLLALPLTALAASGVQQPVSTGDVFGTALFVAVPLLPAGLWLQAFMFAAVIARRTQTPRRVLQTLVAFVAAALAGALLGLLLSTFNAPLILAVGGSVVQALLPALLAGPLALRLLQPGAPRLGWLGLGSWVLVSLPVLAYGGLLAALALAGLSCAPGAYECPV